MKRIIALLLVLVLAMSLAACNTTQPDDTKAPVDGTNAPENPTDAPEVPKDPVTLNIVTSFGADDGHRLDFEAALAAYEAETGNTVNDASATADEAWKMQVLTDFTAGSEPDVLFFFTNADAEPIITANQVVSIEEIRTVYPEYATNMKDALMAVASDGNHYAVPAYGFWENMFVNKAVLEDCGVAVPGPDYTWDQFLADCETIKNAGYAPIACAINHIPHYWFEYLVMNAGSLDTQLEVPELDEDGNLVDNAVAQKWIAGLNEFKTLYDAGYFPENTLTASDDDTCAAFANGEAAFLIDGSWKCGYFLTDHADELDNYAVVCVPGKGDRKATDIIGGISMGYFITRKAWDDPAKRDAAVQLVTKLSCDDVMNTFITTEVNALVNGAKPTVELNPIQKSAADTNAFVTGVIGAVQDTLNAGVRAQLFANVQKVATGEMTAEEAIVDALNAATE